MSNASWTNICDHVSDMDNIEVLEYAIKEMPKAFHTFWDAVIEYNATFNDAMITLRDAVASNIAEEN